MQVYKRLKSKHLSIRFIIDTSDKIKIHFIIMSPIVLFLFFVFLIVYFYKYMTFKPSGKYPPGPIRLPLLGSYLQILLDDFKYPHEAFLKWMKKYDSKIVGFYLGTDHAVVCNDYETCKEIFTKPEFQGRLESFNSKFRTFGRKMGIFNDDGLTWLFSKRFTLRELRDFGFGRRSDNFERIIEEEVRDLVQAIKIEIEGGKSVLLPETFFPPILNPIFYILTGNRYSFSERKQLQDLGKLMMRFLMATNPTGNLIGLIPWIRHFFPKISGYKDLKEPSDHFEKLVRKIFAEHTETIDENSARDFVDVLIKNKNLYSHFTDEQFLIITTDFIFPNSGVAATLTWAIIYLILNPRVHQKCQEEVDSIIGRTRTATLDDRDNLPYIQATLKEVMRIQTLTPLGLGHRATEDTTYFGFDIPKDTFVMPNLWAMHMDEKFWGDPKNFRPERFITQDGKFDNRLTIFPFGNGKRVCAGETFTKNIMFLILTAILQNFTWVEDTKIDFSKNRSGVSIIPQTDLYVKFIPRD